jgi:uncharacterized membrane protein YhaH (DUF805 family)
MSMRHWFFGFHGRIGRGRFLLGFAIVWALLIAIIVVGRSLNTAAFVVVAVMAIIANWSLAVKRLQDCGLPGWLAPAGWIVIIITSNASYSDPDNAALAVISTMIGGSFFVFLIAYPGNKGSNPYG